MEARKARLMKVELLALMEARKARLMKVEPSLAEAHVIILM